MQNVKKGGEQLFGIKQVAVTGVLTALTIVATVFTRVPLTLVHGYFNLGDTVVLTAGVVFGGMTGAVAGAVGSAAADIFTGSYIFAPITFLIKGIEGYVAGKISVSQNKEAKYNKAAKFNNVIVALTIGAGVMVAGYFVAEATVLSLLDRFFGLGSALAELPVNMIQGGASVILARIVIEGLRRSKVV